MYTGTRFHDRRDAGRRLAERLLPFRTDDSVVIGLPRGGVEVAFEVARALDLPLDVIVARKIGAPDQPELGIGAVAPRDILVLDEDTIRELGLSPADIEVAVEQARAEMHRLLREYRGEEDLPILDSKRVILVDDGLATGVTARASIQAARAAGARDVVLAVPVCAIPTVVRLRSEVEELICIHMPERFIAVGAWYDEFHQTSDAQVIELLEEGQDEVSPEDLSEI